MARGKTRDAAVAAAQKEAAALMRLATPKRDDQDTDAKRIARAASGLRWPLARTRHIWNGEVVVRVHEMDALRLYALEEAARQVSSARGTKS